MGSGKPDLVYRHPAGRVRVVDLKVAFTLDSRYVQSRLSAYETDHQLWQYGWEVGEIYGEPVERAEVQQIILTPKAQSIVHPVLFTPERMAFWLRGAEALWAGMFKEQEEGAAPVPRWSSCHGKFGRCPYYEWDHEFGGNEAMAHVYYEKEG